MPIYGIIVSVIFLYFEWDVSILENTTFLLTYATILVLMSLGIALSRLAVVSLTHASILER